MATDSHPLSHANPHHRKIDLQSPLDLAYLRTNLERSAQQKLDLHFPIIPPTSTSTSSSEPPSQDPMRTAVSTLVSTFISQTFSSASHSISINGLDATTVAATQEDKENGLQGEEVEYEAYDPRLTTRLAGLYAEVEGLTMQVAKLRRDAPSQSALDYHEALQKVVGEEEQVMQGVLQQTTTDGGDGVVLDLKVPEGRETEKWQADVQEMYERGLGSLADLTGTGMGVAGENGRGTEKSLTGTVGLVERAGGVAREME